MADFTDVLMNLDDDAPGAFDMDDDMSSDDGEGATVVSAKPAVVDADKHASVPRVEGAVQQGGQGRAQQVAELKAKVEQLQAEKVALIDQEDFIGASRIKEQLQEAEDALREAQALPAITQEQVAAGVLGERQAMVQIAARKANIAKLQKLRDEKLRREDLAAAERAKKQILDEEQAIAAARRLLTGVATPARSSSGGGGAAAKGEPKPFMSAILSAHSAAESKVAPTTKEDLQAVGEARKFSCEVQKPGPSEEAEPTPDCPAAAAEGRPQQQQEQEQQEQEQQEQHKADQVPGQQPPVGEHPDSPMWDANSPTEPEDHKAPSAPAVQWQESAEFPEHLEIISDCESERRFFLHQDAFDRLYAYQRYGVAWLAELWRKQHGGVLADEMGLGKTIQACSLLNGARKGGARHALVLMPVTLLDQWAAEAQIWCPDWPVYKFYGTPAQRERALHGVRRPEGGILLTSYSLLSSDDNLFDVQVLGEDEQPARQPMGAAARKRARARARSSPSKAAEQKEQTSAAEPSAASPPVEQPPSISEAAAASSMQATKRRRLNTKGQACVAQAQDTQSVPQRRRFAKKTKAASPSKAESAAPPERPGCKPWDFVICDEAHRMKSISSLFSKSLRRLRSGCRVLLTGTPVQNSLQDMWSLMDFAQPGMLGNHATFVKHFSDPIERGSVRGASPFAVVLKKSLSSQLRELVGPHLLRRTKVSCGLLADSSGNGGAPPEDRMDENLSALLDDLAAGQVQEMQALPPKRETILWLIPSEEQNLIYQKVLEKSEIIREAANKAKLGIEVFRAIGLLKRLCNHPLLGLPMSKAGAWKEVLAEATESLPEPSAGAVAEDTLVPTEAADVLPDSLSKGAASTEADDARAGRAAEMAIRRLPRDADSMLAQSAKLRCMAFLLPGLVARGHRILVFSQSIKMLDLVQICVLKPHGLRCLRIDGQTDPQLRAGKVKKFQQQPDRFHCMLLTTGVGGVGLNLTGADRVVLVDPAWNPATDAQAVDRAYRIGQTREVRVYRLVTSGFIEDKMFRLQVFKMGLTKTALEGDQHHHYFTAKEIRNLFDWTDPSVGETRQLLFQKHGTGGDEAAEEAALEDGAAEHGWLGDWLAAGASDFGVLTSCARAQAPQKQEQEDGVAAKIAEVKEKLDEADEKRQAMENARKAAEDRIESAGRDICSAVTAISQAGVEKLQAEEAIRERWAELKQAEKTELVAHQLLPKANRIREAAALAQISKRKAHDDAALAARLAEKTAVACLPVARSAETSMSNAISMADASIAVVDAAGMAVAGEGGVPGPANACSMKRQLASEALTKVRTALDAVAIRQAELESIEEELVKYDSVGMGFVDDQPLSNSPITHSPLSARRGAGEAGASRPSGGSSSSNSSSDPAAAAAADSAAPAAAPGEGGGGQPEPAPRKEAAPPTSPPRPVGTPRGSPGPASRRRLSIKSPAKTPAGSPGSRKELAALPQAQRLERWRNLQQYQERFEAHVAAARDAASRAVAEAVEAGRGFVESFERPQEMRVDRFKAAQSSAKSSFRQLAPAWQSLRGSQESWASAVVARRKKAQRAAMAYDARLAADVAMLEAERNLNEVVEEHNQRRAATNACQVALTEAQAARTAAMVSEVSWRQKREQLKVEAFMAKDALRPARQAEREAAAQRMSVLAKYSKVEKQQLKVEEASSTAVMRLRTEQYDANQVEQAYENKKRTAAGDSSVAAPTPS